MKIELLKERFQRRALRERRGIGQLIVAFLWRFLQPLKAFITETMPPLVIVELDLINGEAIRGVVEERGLALFLTVHASGDGIAE